MSGRAWKPGDVAMVTITRKKGSEEPNTYLAFFGGSYGGWQGVLNGKNVGALTNDEEAFDIERRPLVVIDPENCEQVERLASLSWNASPENGRWEDATRETQQGFIDDTQAALRSLVADPKADVYEHLATENHHDGKVTLSSLCGKLWEPNVRSEVNVVGRCPDCERYVKGGWVA